MRIEARSIRDILAGLAFVSIAVAGIWIARNYAMGTPARMGKGFMPVILCSVLALLGIATIIRGLIVNDDESAGLDWRPLVLVVGGFAAFGLTLERFGFVIASALMLTIGYFALPNRKPLEMVLTAGVLIPVCALIFIVALGLPISIGPRF